MAKDYYNLPTDKLSKMALKGDPAASEELTRRYNANPAQGENEANAVSGNSSWPGLQSDTSFRGLLRQIWKNILVPLEPVCLSLLLYIFYLLLCDLHLFFDGSKSFEETPGSFAVLLLFIFLLGRIISGWVHSASQERPLSIFLVLAAMIVWYAMSYSK